MRSFAELRALDREAAPAKCESLVKQVCDELTVLGRIETALLYPAARELVLDEQQINVLALEHQYFNRLVEELRRIPIDDPRWVATVRVLGDYVGQHIAIEERGILNKLGGMELDWHTLLQHTLHMQGHAPRRMPQPRHDPAALQREHS
ncbi:hypothetical protein GCM10027296_06260 [Chitinimonas naiadis]